MMKAILNLLLVLLFGCLTALEGAVPDAINGARGRCSADVKGVPVIDLLGGDEEELAQQISRACENPGFFQVVNHGIPQSLLDEFRSQVQLYYSLPLHQKLEWKRNAANARGFFDDELTKQRLDWKQGLDIGVPGSRDWTLSDDDPLNSHCLDGINRFPPENVLPDYRRITVEYFRQCEALSHRLALLMAKGLRCDPNDAFVMDLAANHSSYLRTNFYPPYHHREEGNLGISPHKDAGFLTVLLQDDDCHSLQVLLRPASLQEDWITVEPIPGALTINTGDMAQVWSNGRFQAPLHRVMTHPFKSRYSAPFFYNPPYHSTVKPIVHDTQNNAPKYHPVLWAYFRALRFAGDLTDLGVEIQIEDFETIRVPSEHLQRQVVFAEHGLTNQRFDVDQYRQLLFKDEK